MGGTKLHGRVYLALIPLTGFALLALVHMVVSLRRPPRDEILVTIAFTTLGLAWNLLSFRTTRSERRGRVALALAPVAFQALIPLAQPLLASLAALTILLVDWGMNRRPLPPALANLSQAVVGIWFAEQVIDRILAQGPGMSPLLIVAAGGLMGAAICSVFGDAVVSVMLLLASGRGPRTSGVLSFPVIANEVIVVCFSAMLAVAWAIHPALLSAVAVPLTLMFLLLARLERREASLERKQDELQAIQNLGLEVSAQLDPERLAEAVTRIVADDLEAVGAYLGTLTEDRNEIRIAAVFDPRPRPLGPPQRVRRELLDDAFFSRGRPMIARGETVRRAREFAPFRPEGVIAHPLTILGQPEGVIVAWHDPGREPFSDDDARRLSGLCRFVEVALNNARLYEDLREMQAQLLQNEKLSALGELVSGVAHELNNPLATVMGSSELLDQQDLPEELKHLVRMIRREANRAARIVRNLLTFSRRQKPQTSWQDLGEIMREVAELRREECVRHDIELRVEAGPDVPPLLIDPDQIHQVLVNLVNNAIHAIEESGRGGTIVLRSKRRGHRVLLSVVDDGPGIPEEILPRIFNPFFTTKKVGKGTGLGLSICYGIVQEHGGAFRVRSAPGQGASFIVELPVPRQGPVEAVPRRDDEKAAGQIVAGADRRVLVVDDEEGVRTLVAEALRMWGFRVRVADSGEAALGYLSAEEFDLVVSDLRMPGVDGMQLWQRVRASGQDTPFVFSTGDAISGDVHEFLERTGAPVLVKPFTLLSMKEAVEQVLESAAEPLRAR
ncbi:MAG: hypothetical protein Kow0062_14140 [Acidobacteriota bacterium]